MGRGVLAVEPAADTGNNEDDRRGLNRTEHLRAIPPLTRTSAGLFRRRYDAESLNRNRERAQLTRSQRWRRRSGGPTYSGFALGLNALSCHRYRKRSAAPWPPNLLPPYEHPGRLPGSSSEAHLGRFDASPTFAG